MSNQINFLPEDYLERRRQQRTNIVCLCLFAVVMAGLIVAFLLDEKRQARAGEQRQAIDQRMESVGEQLSQIEEMQSRKEKMIRKADVTASLLERRPRHYLVALLTNSLPGGASLMNIELSTKDVKVKQPSKTEEDAKGGAPRASKAKAALAAAKAKLQKQDEKTVQVETIRVTGLAPDDKVVSRFMAALDASKLFVQVDLLFSEEYVYFDQHVRRFMLQMDIDEQAQVTDEMVARQRARSGAFN